MLDFIEKIFSILGFIILGILVIGGIILAINFFGGETDSGTVGKVVVIVLALVVFGLIAFFLLKKMGQFDREHPVFAALLCAIFYGAALIPAVLGFLPPWISLIFSFFISIVTSMKAYNNSEMDVYDVEYKRYEYGAWRTIASKTEYIDHGLPGLIIKTIFYVGIPAYVFYGSSAIGYGLLWVPAIALGIKFLFRLIFCRKE